MMFWFKWVKFTWTTEIFPREKFELTFSNRNMIDDSSHRFCRQRVRISKIFELQSTICIKRFDRIIGIINKIKELTFPQIQSLEGHFPITNDIITFTLLTKVLWRLTWISRYEVELFGFSINYFVKWSVIVTWAFPKFYWVVGTEEEKFSEFIWKGWKEESNILLAA